MPEHQPPPDQQPAHPQQRYPPQAYPQQMYPQQTYPPQAPPPYPYAIWPSGPQLTTDRSDKSGQAAVAWILTVLTLGYFLPWAVAASRGKSNAAAVGVLTFLLGWTFVGWVVALVMACGSHQVVWVNPNVVPQYPALPPPGHYTA